MGAANSPLRLLKFHLCCSNPPLGWRFGDGFMGDLNSECLGCKKAECERFFASERTFLGGEEAAGAAPGNIRIRIYPDLCQMQLGVKQSLSSDVSSCLTCSLSCRRIPPKIQHKTFKCFSLSSNKELEKEYLWLFCLLVVCSIPFPDSSSNPGRNCPGGGWNIHTGTLIFSPLVCISSFS